MRDLRPAGLLSLSLPLSPLLIPLASLSERQTSLCNMPGFDLVAGINGLAAQVLITVTVPFDNNFHDVLMVGSSLLVHQVGLNAKHIVFTNPLLSISAVSGTGTAFYYLIGEFLGIDTEPIEANPNGCVGWQQNRAGTSCTKNKQRKWRETGVSPVHH